MPDFGWIVVAGVIVSGGGFWASQTLTTLKRIELGFERLAVALKAMERRVDRVERKLDEL